MMTQDPPRYMSVKQVADYLSLNEKKIYALASEGRIPATKVTGKWMFPRELVDRWMLETSHGVAAGSFPATTPGSTARGAFTPFSRCSSHHEPGPSLQPLSAPGEPSGG